MAATATERKLLIGGEWVETGDRIEVRSPYSNDVVGLVATGGAKEATLAVAAAERAMRDRLPDTSAPRSSSRSPASWAAVTTRSPAVISEEAGKPLKQAKVEVSRAMSTVHLRGRRGPQAGGRDDPDGRVAGR